MFLSSGPAAARRSHSGFWQMLVMLSAALIPLAAARAQSGVDFGGTGGKHTIQGSLYSPSGRRADLRSVRVRLETPVAGELSVFADSNGSFSFRNLTAGSYTIVVEAGEDYEVARESVYIDQARTPLPIDNTPRIINVPIYLQVKRRAAASQKPGVLNAALVNVPAPAVESYQKGLAAVQSGQRKQAVEYFRAAILLYPDFALAYNELGVQYLGLGEVSNAVNALRSAVRLTPDEFTPRLNYGFALMNQKEFDKAEAELRRALQKNETAAVAHLYLGVVHVQQQRLGEAEKEFQRAVSLPGGDSLAQAHRYLGGIYWHKGDYKRAIEELEKYLKLEPKAPDAEKIRQTVNELRRKV